MARIIPILIGLFSHILLTKWILTKILSLAKNDIDRVISLVKNDIYRDISLAKNDIDREGQQQDKKKHQICIYSQNLSLLLQRHPLFGYK